MTLYQQSISTNSVTPPDLDAGEESNTGEFFSVDSFSQKDCCILIVDDSEADRETYQRYITHSVLADCLIAQSDCGEDALILCRERMPDVILLDYLLPDIDGLEFVQALSLFAKVLPPIIMLTGEGSERVAVDALQMGVKDYLVKGELTADVLCQTVQRSLIQHRLERTVKRQQRQRQLMSNVALQVSQSLDIDHIVTTAVNGVRQLLECDRALIYRYNEDKTGRVVGEALLPEWAISFDSADPYICPRIESPQFYETGRPMVINDIHADLSVPAHVEQLVRLQVNACIAVPVIISPTSDSTSQKDGKLWGLIIAHHCRGTRTWQTSEINLLSDLSVQIAIAIRQSELVSTLSSRAEDLTRVNQQLSATKDLLESRNQELDEFAYIASHDLRAPLRAISSLASWLESDLSGNIPAESQEHLELIQLRAKRLDDFINGLLQYSKSGRQSIELTQVNTRELIEEIVDSLAPPTTFRFEYTDVLPTFHAHKLLLQQVLSNLIGNAIKYRDRDDGCVTITIKEQGRRIRFQVCDDGPGIDPSYHEQVFKVFQTAQNRDAAFSTGIGLSIVKKIIEQQGGKITLQSNLGEGCEFTFDWPQTEAQTQ